MPNFPWFNVEEGIQTLREIEMLEWIYHLRPTHPYREGPEDIAFVTTVGNKLCGGIPSILEELHDHSPL